MRCVHSDGCGAFLTAVAVSAWHQGPSSSELVLHAQPAAPPCLQARAAPRGLGCWAPLALTGKPGARHTLTLPVLAVPFQGFVPAAIRLVPHTVLTFVFLEQLRKYFGIKVIT